jgi:hypothetical protein
MAIALAFTVTANAQQQLIASNQTTTSSAPAAIAVCSWKNMSTDFGKIPQGKPVSYTYEFTNTGKAPLIIASVNPTCGCTTQDYSKDAIAPGKKGFVTLTYNAASVGKFTKTTVVNTNAEGGTFNLTFTGEVVTN